MTRINDQEQRQCIHVMPTQKGDRSIH